MHKGEVVALDKSGDRGVGPCVGWVRWLTLMHKQRGGGVGLRFSGASNRPGTLFLAARGRVVVLRVGPVRVRRLGVGLVSDDFWCSGTSQCKFDGRRTLGVDQSIERIMVVYFEWGRVAL